jgi:hypothetical protein
MTLLKKTRNWGIGLGAVAATLIGLGADAPPQKIDAGGLTFQAPGSWKSSKPSSSMRRAQLSVDPVEGDTEPAELVVFSFPGGAGTVEANIERWRGQFRDGENKPPKIESKTVKGKNVDVTRVETAGRYVAPEFPGSSKAVNKPNFRLLGAIVQTDRGAFFLKMIGPDRTMLAARSAFDDLIASMEAEK